jgi:predicted nucleic-acid-binding Zn-ribbon protein
MDGKMKNGKCPKCSSREIFKHSAVTARSNLAVSFFNQAKLEDYVCTQCGYLESYVNKAEDLKKIKKKWKRVGY